MATATAGFIKRTAADTYTIDTNTYLTSSSTTYDAGNLAGTTLKSTVINSSLTKLGTGAGFVKSDASGNLSVDTIYEWAKNSYKPYYYKSEIIGLTNNDTVQFTGLTLNAGIGVSTLNLYGPSATAGYYTYISNTGTTTTPTLSFTNTSFGTLGFFDSVGNFYTQSVTSYNNMTVGYGQNSSSINMYDLDEGTRIIHCNSNKIGFLTQAGAWGSYCEDDGSWVSEGDITAFSDASLKENVITINSALDKTLKLRGVYYTRKDKKDNIRKVGVIAQEVQEILPEVVKSQHDVTKNNTILSVDYGNITALLIEAIKELNAKVEDLQNQLANK